MIVSKVTGMGKILRNIKKSDAMLMRRLSVGLKKGGLHLQRESQKIVPVDLGPLKASAFTRSIGTKKKPHVIVGYTAGYATPVHENLDAKHGAAFNAAYSEKIGFKSRGPNQQAKFLEAPARQHRKTILTMIYHTVKIGMGTKNFR